MLGGRNVVFALVDGVVAYPFTTVELPVKGLLEQRVTTVALQVIGMFGDREFEEGSHPFFHVLWSPVHDEGIKSSQRAGRKLVVIFRFGLLVKLVH